MENILLCVSGMSPQIVTETLWFYTQVEKIKIHRIIILTTKAGEKTFNETLLNWENGLFVNFCKEFGFNPSEIGIKIETLKNKNGEALEDIRTKEENEDVLYQILTTLKELTKSDFTRVFASVSGGRKTMGIYLSFAMELFARKEDKLSHVLVSPSELENSKDFGFLPKNETFEAAIGFGSNAVKKTFQAKDVSVEVAEVPFFRMRQNQSLFGLYKNLEDLSQIREVIQNEIDLHKVEPKIILDFEKKLVILEREKGVQETVKLTPKNFALYTFLLGRKTLEPKEKPKALDELQKYATENFKNDTIYDKYSIKKYRIIEDEKEISSEKGKINKKLENQLSKDSYELVKISGERVGRKERLFFKHSLEKIDFKNVL